MNNDKNFILEWSNPLITVWALPKKVFVIKLQIIYNISKFVVNKLFDMFLVSVIYLIIWKFENYFRNELF